MKKLPKKIYVAWNGNGKDMYLESTISLDENGLAMYGDSVLHERLVEIYEPTKSTRT